jgi:formate hydrogenlyase transcriptional activator
MKYFYFVSSDIVLCTALVACFLSLLLAVGGNARTDLVFSMLGLAVILFFIMPPAGYESVTGSGEQAAIISRRICLLAYCLSGPWFLKRTTFPRKTIWTYSFFVVATTSILIFLFEPIIIWRIVSLVSVTGIVVLGSRALVWQYRRTAESRRARLIVCALSIYQLVFLLMLLLYQTNILPAIPTAPANFFSLVFVMTIAVMLAVSVVERNRLSKVHQVNEKRLQSVMQNAPVMVLELDKDGTITYVNDFGVKLLRYTDASELVNVNWFNAFLLPSDIPLLRKLYSGIFQGNLMTATFKNTIRCRDGAEIIISWVNFVVHEPDGSIQKVISIGRDISVEESANKLVAQMQKELEKEKIVLEEPAHFELEENVVGKSKAFTYTLQRARQVAITHAPVLLEGETGVGKEVFANLIHKNSSRSKMPFIKVNCGALPKELMEDELFGHEKGAFTSAIQSRKGRFELADGGTIFLDEIGELPLDMQPKLLRVLQNGEFERVGGQKTINVDVRILAATNRNLLDETNNGNFREDLYYRLNVFPITVPALRNRKEDLPDLIQYFIATKCKEYNRLLEQVSTADMERLIDYRWPGNIRELKNVIERAVIVSEGRVLKLDWWQDNEFVTEIPAGETLERVERDHIITVIERCRWKINGDHGAAEVLNMHPNTLRSKMKRLGISRPQSKSTPEFGFPDGYFPKESMG